MKGSLALQDVSRSFGAVKAVRNLNLTVAQGEILGLIGPNGAGKTTTMRMLAGVLRPSQGRVSLSIDGTLLDPEGSHAETFRSNVGFLPEGAPLWPHFTVWEFLNDCARLRRTPDAATVISQTIAMMNLQGMEHRLIQTLSKGFRRRVALAATLLHNPMTLLLDEPSDGLDPNQKRDLHHVIRTLSKSKAIVVSTHALDEVTALCSRAVVIAHGRVVADAPVDELLRSTPDFSMETLFRKLTYTPTQPPS